jgi:chaperonin GroEL
MAKPQQTAFYSWQSDSPPKANRNFIQTALKRAIEAVKAKESIAVEPVFDSDTRNVAGAPKISDTIFNKIDASSVFVADVTIIRRTAGKTARDRKALPNPNVLVELGYALKALGDERLVLVANTSFGRIEDLPFDLLGRRTIPYTLSEKDLENSADGQRIRRQVRDQLQGALETAIESILLLPPRDLNQLPAALLILQGAKSLRDRAAATIGPRGGRTAYIGRDGERVLTRDGLLISKHLTSRDHHSREGIELLSKTAEEIRRQVGDGAKTALLLCYEMVNGGYEAIESNEPLDEVLDGMERSVEKTVGYIKKRRKSANRTDVFSIAKTAGGIVAAKLVDEAYERAPSEGLWWVQDDVAPATSSVEIQEGIRFNGGYLADEFANDPSGDCILENCFVLVYEGKIHSSNELAPIIGLVAEAKKPILVLAENVEGSALELLVINNNQKLSCVAVKAPGYSQDKRNWLKDIAAITGTSVLGGIYGKKLETALLSDLGTAERVVVEKDVTQIIAGSANQKRIEIRLAQLRRQISETPSVEQTQLQDRIANLLGKTAVIRIGGTTRDALLDNHYNVETSMRSVHLALAHGYVVGGGLTYYEAAKALQCKLELKSLTKAEKIGIKVVQRALHGPIQSLLYTGRETIEEFEKNSGKPEIGFNLATKKYDNLRTAGVLDAARVAAAAVQIAFSHARTILETTSWDTIRPNLPFL